MIKKIFLFVFIAHISLLLIGKKEEKKTRKKIHVTTLQAAPPKKIVAKAAQKTIQSKKKAPSKKKQTAKNPKKKKKIAAKKKPIPKKVVSKSKNDALITSLEKSLEALQKPTTFKAKSKDLQLPKITIAKESSSPTTSFDERALIGEIAAYLKQELELPEYGPVTMQITFSMRGVILSMKTLSSKSTKNERYLKNRLQELTFPCFNEDKLSEITLEFVFQNESF